MCVYVIKRHYEIKIILIERFSSNVHLTQYKSIAISLIKAPNSSI